MDTYLQISVSMPDGEPFGYKIKVKNPYGVMKKADDPRKVFKDIIAGALARYFGGQSVTVESSYLAKPADERAALAAAYVAKHGRRPHPAMSLENLRDSVA